MRPIQLSAILISALALSSCGQSNICKVDDKESVFESFSGTVDEFVAANHAKFTQIGAEKNYSFSFPSRREGIQYSFYANSPSSLKMKLEETSSGDFSSEYYGNDSQGRRYFVMTAKQGNQTLFAGFACGYPEADGSLYQALSSPKGNPIHIKRYQYEGGEYTKKGDTESAIPFKSAPSHPRFPPPYSSISVVMTTTRYPAENTTLVITTYPLAKGMKANSGSTITPN